MRKLVHRLFVNFDLKIISALLAVLTWYYLATAGVEERRFPRVTPRIINLPPNVARRSPRLPNVTVVLRGPRGQLDALEGRQIVAQIDLGHVQADSHEPVTTSVRLSDTTIRLAGEGDRSLPLPHGVGVVRAEPESINVTLERLAARELPVKVATKGDPAPGYTLVTAAQPPRVVVRGPFRLLQTLTAIRTETIPVDGLREHTRHAVALLKTIDTKDGPVAIFPTRPTVVATLDVAERPEEQAFARVPVRLGPLPKDLAVIRQEGHVDQVTLTLGGPRRLLDQVDGPNLVVDVPLDTVTAPENGTKPHTIFFLPENVRQTAQPGTSLPLPLEIRHVDFQPKTIQLIIDRMHAARLPVAPVLEGQPAADHEITKATAVPAEVQVRGPKSVIAQLKSIETEPILVNGLREGLRRQVRLVHTVDVAKFRGVAIAPARPSVDVVLAVAEKRVRKTLTGLPVRLIFTPPAGLAISVDMEPKTLGPVVFEGPASRVAKLTPDSVVAFVRIEIATAADLRPTIRTAEFHIVDPQIRLAPDHKAVTVKLGFPSLEPAPKPPEKPKPAPPDAPKPPPKAPAPAKPTGTKAAPATSTPPT